MKRYVKTDDKEILDILKKHLIFTFNGTQYGFQFYGIDEEIACKLSNYFNDKVLDFEDTRKIKIKKLKITGGELCK